MEKEMIEKKAKEVMAEVHYEDNSDEIDVIEIAKKLGFAVGNAVLKDDVDGFIIVQEGAKEILGIETDKLIGVNSEKDLEWKRFTIAHEIAHYVLHYSNEKYKGMFAHRDHRKGKNEIENEADYFAANLLMPSEKFQEKYKELESKGLDVEEIIVLLSSKFVVTPLMTRRRIEELNLIG
ncbi:MAG: ImmA/IrrE family metallo-endopeptidase [Lachnospiraceae bacterium]|nr:ImmA/IrrE family metallo-endopeptidase [Lachnospiraceae bacterium]